jgi:pimeloyl-ACP methyl ester carboxylesterase
MTAVFVHGVPDTARMWEPLVAELARTDVVALSLPGFATPHPDGFGATKEDYVDFVITELEAVGEPVDLVGHDWGSILVQRVVSLRPDLVRTWACGSGPADREYVWHDMAQLWQTPEVGEQVMDAMTPDALAGFLELEIGPERAVEVASNVDDRMRSCILALYRSAVKVGDEWHDEIDAIERPGLVLWGADDPYAPATYGERLGERTGARVVIFEDTAHWWPVTRARDAARELEVLWASA